MPGRPGGRAIEPNEKRLRRLTVLFLIASLALISGPGALAGGPGEDRGDCLIRDVSLRKKSLDLVVDFRVAGAIDREVEDTIQSGLPRTLSFLLELYRPRPLLPDRRLRAWRLAHTIRYDNLKDEFLITRTVTAGGPGAGKSLPPIVLRGLPNAVKAAANVQGFPLALAESGTPVRYLLRIRARVEPFEEGDAPWFGHLPVPLLPSFGQRKSDWYVQEFEF